MLGIKPGFSGRAASVLNCWAISPGPGDHFLNNRLIFIVHINVFNGKKYVYNERVPYFII